MKSQCLRIPIRKGQTERFSAWARSLASRQKEVLEAFRAQGMNAEAIFLERGEERDHVFFYTRAQDLYQASTVFQQSALKLDQETRQMMAECWDLEECSVLEPLAELLLDPGAQT